MGSKKNCPFGNTFKEPFPPPINKGEQKTILYKELFQNLFFFSNERKKEEQQKLSAIKEPLKNSK